MADRTIPPTTPPCPIEKQAKAERAYLAHWYVREFVETVAHEEDERRDAMYDPEPEPWTPDEATIADVRYHERLENPEDYR